MSLAERLRANAALLDHITRTAQRLTAPHRRALIADLLEMAVEAERIPGEAVAAAIENVTAEALIQRRKVA